MVGGDYNQQYSCLDELTSGPAESCTLNNAARPACSKFVRTIDDREEIIRSCVDLNEIYYNREEDTCDSYSVFGIDYEHCICIDNSCNSAGYFRASALTVASTLLWRFFAA